MLPPEDRLVGAQLHRYIRDKLYWVLHAPRQTGKTTFLQSWMREINAEGEAIACYVSVERCQGITDIDRAMPAICNSIREHTRQYDLPVPELDDIDSAGMLYNILANWSRTVAPKPLVVLFDEVDVVEGDAMISLLRQLRNGFATRGVGKFPVSIVLVGMRDLKDYITASKDGVTPNPGSPFNIKSDSASLSNFQKEDIAHLFAQRTAENGQQITHEALDYIYDQSKGQPWIVNSLLMRATLQILHEDSAETVTVEYIRDARERMIQARETHLDALAYRLEDQRIRSVIEPILTGESDPDLAKSDAFRICLDLGLVALDDGTPVIANPIYREVIARHLTFGPQLAIPKPVWQWEKPDGSLDMDRLMQEFQKFWRRHADIWESKTKSPYTEAFPHLLLMAFLQRVLNGNGHIERECAAGRGRMDLGVEYKGRQYVIEIKLIRNYNSPQAVREEGLEQIKDYCDKFAPSLLGKVGYGLVPAFLVLFDRRSKTKKKSWDERITWEQDGNITILGC
jgi:hypothetical protein